MCFLSFPYDSIFGQSTCVTVFIFILSSCSLNFFNVFVFINVGLLFFGAINLLNKPNSLIEFRIITAIACNTGEDACAAAEYAVLDDSGTKRCCPDNSTLQSFRFRLKGKKLFTCACLLDTQEDGAWMSSYGLSFLDSQDAFNATALIGDIAVNQNAWADYAYRMANNMWKVLQNAFRWF